MNEPTPTPDADAGRGLLTLNETATRLRCSPKSVRRFVKAGRLPCVRYTKSLTEPLKFRGVDVARFIERSVEDRRPPL